VPNVRAPQKNGSVAALRARLALHFNLLYQMLEFRPVMIDGYRALVSALLTAC